MIGCIVYFESVCLSLSDVVQFFGDVGIAVVALLLDFHASTWYIVGLQLFSEFRFVLEYQLWHF
jgi:hypothetical protein